MSPAIELGIASGRHAQRTALPWRAWLGRLGRRRTLLLQAGAIWDAGPARAAQGRAQHYDDFEAWCAAHPHTACELLVSGTLLHELVCDPALPVSHDVELLDHARAVFVHYHGPSALAWPLATWAAQGQHGVSALHGVDMAPLLHSARMHGVHIASLQPWWARALGLALMRWPLLRNAPRAWLLVVEANFVQALCLEAGRCVSVRAQWLSDGGPVALELFADRLRAESAAADARVPCLALGHGLAPGALSRVQVLGRLDGNDPPLDWLVDRGELA